MKQHRFFGTFDFSATPLVIADPLIVYQMKRVLRMQPGDSCILCSYDGVCMSGTLKAFIKETAEFSMHDRIKTADTDMPEIVLYCAILKRENFEWVVQKATEIGVARIVPLITVRTIKQSLKRDRLEKIIREAAEQSQRSQVPLIQDPQEISAVLTEHLPGMHIAYDPSGSSQAPLYNNSVTHIYIGPEGGWDQTEIADFHKAGIALHSLGQLILRAETAAVVATYEAVTHHL